MEDSKQHILVYSGDRVAIQKLQNDLEAAGINVFVKDTSLTATITGFVDFQYPKLFILESDAAKAKPIVDKFKEQFKL